MKKDFPQEVTEQMLNVSLDLVEFLHSKRKNKSGWFGFNMMGEDNSDRLNELISKFNTAYKAVIDEMKKENE